MVYVCFNHIRAAAVLLLFCSVAGRIDASTVTTAPQPTSISNILPSTCEFRTINYITDSLPQMCGKSSWSNSNVTSSTKYTEGTVSATEALSSQSEAPSNSAADSQIVSSQDGSTESGTVSTSTSSSPTASVDGQTADLEAEELNDASFLSFEDWKKQTLEKAGQANTNIGNKRSGEKKKDSESFQNSLDSLGEEGELDLDFGAFGSGAKSEEASQTADAQETATPQDSHSEGSLRQYRSKDAGITCKERFSYASFDAGATILKTHPGAKNPKAVLIENKDSYMLSECSTVNKFLIIELSEDIWIDTLVLANYEFFSSMIRNFRVSVSDKYPVKAEKWKDIGTYEARNSREIQAFLIENPQIWARYIRIEFLSHFGNEYYCPLSLIRVHGTRMLESWKETESIGDDDEGDDGEGHGVDEHFVPDAVADVVQQEEKLGAELKEAQSSINDLVKTVAVIATDHFETNSGRLVGVDSSLGDAATLPMTSGWERLSLEDLFDQLNSIDMPNTCFATDAPIVQPTTPVITTTTNTVSDSIMATSEVSATTSTSPITAAASQTSHPITITSSDGSASSETSVQSSTSSNITRTTSEMQESTSSTTAGSVTSKHSVNLQKNKTTSTASAVASLPTIQESFFKAVSRRLQLLEANSTLSLKYIEEQSRILREAFSKVEKKQLHKTTTFLDAINGTVLAELRVFRQQYDEIWQSTVISLESQREESRREILAISARLNILADEVVFQKRMSIVQSLLLLLCLGLVIFSRVSAAGHLDIPSLQTRARAFGFPTSPLESPLESPGYRRNGPMRESEWLDDDSRIERSDGSPVPFSRERSPPTPVSNFSRSDDASTPPSGGDDLTAPSGHVTGYSEHLELPSSSPSRSFRKRVRGHESFTADDSSTHSENLEHGIEGGVGNQSLVQTWTRRSGTNESSLYPSPPPESLQSDFGISRKPLPALPTDA